MPLPLVPNLLEAGIWCIVSPKAVGNDSHEKLCQLQQMHRSPSAALAPSVPCACAQVLGSGMGQQCAFVQLALQVSKGLTVHISGCCLSIGRGFPFLSMSAKRTSQPSLFLEAAKLMVEGSDAHLDLLSCRHGVLSCACSRAVLGRQSLEAVFSCCDGELDGSSCLQVEGNQRAWSRLPKGVLLGTGHGKGEW